MVQRRFSSWPSAAGCATDTQDIAANAAKDAAKDAAQDMVEDTAGQVYDDVSGELSQQLVNFRCTLADGRTIYFLKEKAKVVSPTGESWLNDDGYFAKFTIDDKDYLVHYPAEESDMSFEAMMTTYEVSKTSPGYDCELNVVQESDVDLPDIEVITPEELGDLMMQQMMAQGT